MGEKDVQIWGWTSPEGLEILWFEIRKKIYSNRDVIEKSEQFVKHWYIHILIFVSKTVLSYWEKDCFVDCEKLYLKINTLKKKVKDKNFF